MLTSKCRIGRNGAARRGYEAVVSGAGGKGSGRGKTADAGAVAGVRPIRSNHAGVSCFPQTRISGPHPASCFPYASQRGSWDRVVAVMWFYVFEIMVGATGIEPVTPTMST